MALNDYYFSEVGRVCNQDTGGAAQYARRPATGAIAFPAISQERDRFCRHARTMGQGLQFQNPGPQACYGTARADRARHQSSCNPGGKPLECRFFKIFSGLPNDHAATGTTQSLLQLLRCRPQPGTSRRPHHCVDRVGRGHGPGVPAMSRPLPWRGQGTSDYGPRDRRHPRDRHGRHGRQDQRHDARSRSPRAGLKPTRNKHRATNREATHV